MQTENAALTALTNLIETTGNDEVDDVNHVLGAYPAVWATLFEHGATVDDDELTTQAIAATAQLERELAATAGDEDAEATARRMRVW